MPHSIGIFILPPSLEALSRRLNHRGQDSQAVIARRLSDAQSDMAHYVEADYVVINDDFNAALADLKAIVRASRLRVEAQSVKQAALIQGLIQP
jgi:guanylate kinase